MLSRILKRSGAPQTQQTPVSDKKSLGVFSLVMINIIAFDNLRSLPFSAEYGFSLIFFYLLVALVFLIPAAILTTVMISIFPNQKGGLYIWLREAFGIRWGFLIIWLQWVYNIAWYPTVLAFLAATCSYLIDPQLTHNKTYMLTMILSFFWLSTLLNCFGMKLSGVISTVGAILGTLLPMSVMIVLGFTWLYQGKPMYIEPSWHTLLPHLNHKENLSFLVAILFGLVGIEMSAVHANEVKTPEKAYPKAICISTVITLSFLICASLMIAFIIPKSNLSVVNGLNQAFHAFSHAYHIEWIEKPMILLILIGGISGVAAWIIGPTKSLVIAARDCHLPNFLLKTNTHHAPIPLLVLQGVICTLLSCVFLLMPSVSSSYWLLTVMTAQLALIVYLALFVTGYRLYCMHAGQSTCMRIPGGKWTIGILSWVGGVTCLLAIIFGFIPPTQVPIGSLMTYETLLVTGILCLSLPPFFLMRHKPHRMTNRCVHFFQRNLNQCRVCRVTDP